MWQNFTYATCFELVNKCFCEIDHASAIIRQPINSFSSIIDLGDLSLPQLLFGLLGQARAVPSHSSNHQGD